MSDLSVMLSSLAQAMVPPGRGFWLRAQEKEIGLNRAVERALDTLALETPPPSTTDLWKSGSPPILSAADLAEYEGRAWIRRDSPRFQSRRRANEDALRALPDGLLRAVLTAHCPERASKLSGATRALLEELVKVHLSRIDYAGLFSEEKFSGSYAFAYESPRERELEAISRDDSRSAAERLGASRELGAIQAKRIADNRSKEAEIVGALWQAQHGRLRASSEPSYRKCRHGNYTPLCSACARVPPNDLDQRFSELAAQAGYSSEAFLARTKGRPTSEEAVRLDALARAIETLIAEGHTAESIGRLIGGGRQRVSALRKRNKKSPTKAPT